jgi:hypothetical protein
MRKPEPCGLFPIVQKEQEQSEPKTTVFEEVASFLLTCVISILSIVLIPVIVVGWCLLVQYVVNMLAM